MGVTSTLTAILQVEDARTNSLGTLKDTINLDISDTLADGAVLDTMDAIWRSRRTLTATSESLDLRGGLTDAFGVALSFAILKLLIVRVRTATAGTLLKLGGAANAVPLFGAAADFLNLGPDGRFIWLNPSLAGIALSAGSTDELKLDAGAQTIEYDIVIGGVKA